MGWSFQLVLDEEGFAKMLAYSETAGVRAAFLPHFWTKLKNPGKLRSESSQGANVKASSLSVWFASPLTLWCALKVDSEQGTRRSAVQGLGTHKSVECHSVMCKTGAHLIYVVNIFNLFKLSIDVIYVLCTYIMLC